MVGNYTMPNIIGAKDYAIPGERPPDDDRHGKDDDGGGVGEIPLEGEQDYLDELGDKEPEFTGEEEKEMESANEEYQRLFKDIVDALEYKNVYFMIPLKTRTAPEVEAAIRLMYVQLRAEGLPLQRIHSDRARELRGQGIRRWLLQRDVYPTTGEAQSPQSNGKAELVVKMLKRRARTLLQSSGLPRSCWPLAMSHAAWAQREFALGRSKAVVPFGSPVAIKAKVFGQGGKFDLDNKWDNGVFVGPSTELRGGFVVRDPNGRYLTTMHMKANLVDVDEFIKPDLVEAILPVPTKRLRRKEAVVEGDDGDVPLPTRDSERGSSSSGPPGEVVVPMEGDVPLPTRDSELGSSSSDPYGEVVVPKDSVSHPGGGLTEDREPSRRLTEKTRLMAIEALTPLEQAIEDLAIEYDLGERYDEEAVLRIYDILERTRQQGSLRMDKKSQTTSTSWSTGMYTHGGVSGLRTSSSRMPATTVFMVKAAKELTGKDSFGVVTVARGAQLRAHRDSHNHANSENTVLALTDFQGGELWVEKEGGHHWREVQGGRWVQGDIRPLSLGEPVTFSPKKWHETQCFQGDRVVLMVYTPRTSKLTDQCRAQLRDLGFNIPPKLDLQQSLTQATELKQQYLIHEDDVLKFYPQNKFDEEEDTPLDGALVRSSELQEQIVDEMLDRSTLLQDLLEEEEERIKDLHDVQQCGLEAAKQIHGEIMQMLENVTNSLANETKARDESFLRAMAVEDVQDYEKLLEELEGDLQVTHTVPLQQVKPVAERWREPIQKEIKNLFEGTGTLRKIKMSEARRLEAEGKLRLVPSKGVFTLKLPSQKGGRYKRKYRLVLCGNFVDPNDSYGSLYAGGVSAESLRTILSATTRRGWKGATTDITAAFLQALWPENMPMYAVVPPRLLQDLKYAEEGEAWLVLRPLYGLRESPAIWSAHRNSRLKRLEIGDGDRRVILQQSKTDPELWFAVTKQGEEETRGSLLALLITYVDDLFYVGPEGLVRKLHGWVCNEWPCSGLQWAMAPEGIRYLGMEICQRETGEYAITQRGYIMDLIRAHNLTDEPKTMLPCPKEWVTDDVDQEPEVFVEADLRMGQRLIGEQLWLAMRCRPDIRAHRQLHGQLG